MNSRGYVWAKACTVKSSQIRFASYALDDLFACLRFGSRAGARGIGLWPPKSQGSILTAYSELIIDANWLYHCQCIKDYWCYKINLSTSFALLLSNTADSFTDKCLYWCIGIHIGRLEEWNTEFLKNRYKKYVLVERKQDSWSWFRRCHCCQNVWKCIIGLS